MTDDQFCNQKISLPQRVYAVYRDGEVISLHLTLSEASASCDGDVVNICHLIKVGYAVSVTKEAPLCLTNS